MEKTKTNKPKEKFLFQNDEINLLELVKTIWEGRIFIIKWVIGFVLIGLFVAFTIKVEYEASCKLMPESQEGFTPNLGGLGSLAGLAGINLNIGESGALTPELYPEIAQSVPFLISTWNQPIYFNKKDTLVDSYSYFKELDRVSIYEVLAKYSFGLPYEIKKLISNNNDEFNNIQVDSSMVYLSFEDTELLEKYENRIIVSIDPKTGILSLTTKMPDAVAAAELAKYSINLLTEYVTDYKVGKARENLSFIQARYNEAKVDFENIQEKLAISNDRNRNVVTSLAQAELQRIQNEYDLAFEVYKGLASQLEQAKIKVKEDTPVFTILEPVKIPVEKSQPKRGIILISFFILGVFFSCTALIVKRIFIS